MYTKQIIISTNRTDKALDNAADETMMGSGPLEKPEIEDSMDSGASPEDRQHQAATRIQALERQRQTSRRYRVNRASMESTTVDIGAAEQGESDPNSLSM